MWKAFETIPLNPKIADLKKNIQLNLKPTPRVHFCNADSAVNFPRK
jgi:hypothetical protein